MGVNDLFLRINEFLSGESDLALFITLFLLFFILVFIGVRKVLFTQDKEKGIVAIISLTISLLAVVYLSKSQLFVLVTVYRGVGLFLWSFISFVVLILFSHAIGPTSNIRRLIILVCVGIYYYYVFSAGNIESIFNLILGVFFLVVIVFDKNIGEFIFKVRLSRKSK